MKQVSSNFSVEKHSKKSSQFRRTSRELRAGQPDLKRIEFLSKIIIIHRIIFLESGTNICGCRNWSVPSSSIRIEYFASRGIFSLLPVRYSRWCSSASSASGVLHLAVKAEYKPSAFFSFSKASSNWFLKNGNWGSKKRSRSGRETVRLIHGRA